MSLAENMKNLRKAAGLTQSQLAKKTGSTQWAITNYERGLSNPTAKKLPIFAKALGVSIEELYGVNGKELKGKNSNAPKGKREKKIQELFGKLTPAKQRAVIDHAKGLLK